MRRGFTRVFLFSILVPRASVSFGHVSLRTSGSFAIKVVQDSFYYTVFEYLMSSFRLSKTVQPFRFAQNWKLRLTEL